MLTSVHLHAGLTLNSIQSEAALARLPQPQKSRLVYFATLPIEDKVKMLVPHLTSDGLLSRFACCKLACLFAFVRVRFIP